MTYCTSQRRASAKAMTPREISSGVPRRNQRSTTNTSSSQRWATLPSDQQSALREAFRRYTVAIYVTNFDSFSGQRFEIQPASTAAGEEQIVQTRIVPASGESHRLDYVMRQVSGTWKIVDVLADGSISRVAVQRSEMRSPLASGGVPALLDRLQRKTADMSGGQLR